MSSFDPKFEGKRRNGAFYHRFPSRFENLASNNLGVIGPKNANKILVRSNEIDLYDKYYDCTQYDHLSNWDESCSASDYVAVRKRRPRINYAFAKMLTSRVASKLVGHGNFPSLSVTDDPDTTEFLKIIQKASMFQARMIEPVRRLVNSGSVFVRFQIAGQAIKIEWYNSKYCYPKFDGSGELVELMVKYVYDDQDDLDSKGDAKRKWHKMILSTSVDILFDNPEYKPNIEPVFDIVSEVQHDLGYVQGHWFRTSEERDSVDGYSLVSDLTDFIDEMNYNLSQSSQAIGYNQDPQTIINGMTEDELDELVRSSSKAWNLGREGKASMLESNMGGVKAAMDLRDRVRLGIQDISRVVLLDPEKMAAHAQSGRAMEIMHGPFVELLNELRPWVERGIISLILKMALTILLIEERGMDGPITIPTGYKPKSLDITADWPPVFPLTMSDLKEMLGVATQATSANIFSREWAARWLAKIREFGVDDIETELQKVAAQPVINPFGGF